jgi:hypothetical protein
VWNVGVESIKYPKWRALDPKLMVYIGMLLWKRILEKFQREVADG